jgi:uncharacterized protein (TIGR02246 family)
MKHRTGWSLLIVLALLASTATAQQASSEREADHQQLRELMASVQEAANALDADALAPHFTEPFSIIMVDQSLITDVQGLRDYFDRFFRQPDSPLEGVTVTLEADELTRFLGDSVGVNHGTSHDVYALRGGGEMTLDSRWTGTFVKQDGHWRITALHLGVDMLDNAILEGAKGLWVWWGGGGLLAGILLGLLLFRRRG